MAAFCAVAYKTHALQRVSSTYGDPLDAHEIALIGLARIIAAAACYFAFFRVKRGSSN